VEEIKKLFELIGHKKITVYIMVFSIFVALIEFVGLALIVPYVSIAVNQTIPDNKYVSYITDALNIQTFPDFMVFASCFVVSFYILRLVINLIYNYVSLRFVNKMRHIVMSKLFNHYAYIDYAHFVFRNSSDLKKTLLQESLNTQNIIQSMIDIISELFVLLFLMGLILYTDWKLAVVLTVIFGVVFYMVTFFLKAKVNLLADDRKGYARELHRQVDETLNNFKFTKLIGAEGIRTAGFNENSYGLFRVNSSFQLINQTPKFVLETFGFIVIVAIIFYLIQSGSSEALIGTLGVYAIAFYRGLPSLNKIISSFNNFQYFKNTITQVHDDLKILTESYSSKSKILFNEVIELKNISFRYEGTNENLFNDFNLTIRKGDKVAITGKSGCGKSTLADILMGILRPQKGNVVVDGALVNETNMNAWRAGFGYIPQEIYLYDGTVADNVAFGREYDETRVIEVLKLANIYEYLQAKNGIETLVGEGGIQLSGGQKQRIGIARALYSDPHILVLDEATSALDNETEALIMDEIYKISEDKTLIIIAHRLSTVKSCKNKIILE